MLNGVKIGHSKISLKTLEDRHACCYGDNLTLIYVDTFNPQALEKKTLDNFTNYKIADNILKKEHLNDYINFINNHKITTLNDLNIEDTLLA